MQDSAPTVRVAASPGDELLPAWVVMPSCPERDVIVEALHSLACEVQLPADAQAVIELLAQTSPSLVLLSECLCHPGLSEQMVETLRDGVSRKPCSFVVVTKDANRVEAAPWLALGVDEFLEAPTCASSARFRIAPLCRIGRLRRELQEAEGRAESATRTKTEFLRNINHELRTPMTTIQGLAEMLLDEEIDTQTPGSRGSSLLGILDHAKELTQRIDNLLELSRLEGGAMEIRLRDESPLDILDTIQKDFRHLAEGKGLGFSVTLSGAMPRTVLTDATCLKEVLRHVVGNAVKFTARGEVTIRSRVLAKLSRPLWQLEIRDTGIGIPADKLNVLFRPFVQADMSPSRDHGGVGVGLAISKRLIQMLGGSVQVHSTKGEGTTISLSVETGPLDAIEMLDETAAMSLLSRAPAPVPASPFGSCKLQGRILLAEDAIANQRILAAILSKAGAEVEIVENGQLAADAALDAAERGNPFHLILMDMQMPVLDGYHATTLLRSHGYQFPIVALTAHTIAGERESCLAVGCDDYLTKPVERESFVSFVSQYCASEDPQPVAARAGSC